MRKIILILVSGLVMLATACGAAPAAVPPLATPVAGSSVSSAPQSNSAASASATLAPRQAVHVDALDDYFRPEKITVTVGTQVTWTNVGQKTHTVTMGKTFDSDIKPGQSFSYTFDKPGTYQYYCVTHSESETEGMVGTVTVSAP
jgi:manganese oxidase